MLLIPTQHYIVVYISWYCILNFSTLPLPPTSPSLDLAANQQGAPSKDLINRLYRPPQASAIYRRLGFFGSPRMCTCTMHISIGNCNVQAEIFTLFEKNQKKVFKALLQDERSRLHMT